MLFVNVFNITLKVLCKMKDSNCLVISKMLGNFFLHHTFVEVKLQKQIKLHCFHHF